MENELARTEKQKRRPQAAGKGIRYLREPLDGKGLG
jgi:hypothetical protein